MELYLLTTILLVLMNPGIMKIEARFDITNRNVIIEDSNSGGTCHKQSVLLTHDKLSETCGMLHPEQQFEARIINGHKAEPGQFPFAVKITDNTRNGDFFCGGSIIDSKYILTAAHCITQKKSNLLVDPEELTVEVGAHFFNLSSQDRDCRVKHEVKKLNIHSQYLNPTASYDIGIIELKEPINFEYYQGGYGSRGMICLSHGDEDLVRVGQKLSVAGWGDTDVFQHEPEMLNFDTYQVLDRNECINISYNEICMKGSTVYKSAFKGDSGSALFAKTGNQSYMQVGIVSRPNWCYYIYDKVYKRIDICFNAIYTRVDYHLKWIESIIGKKPIQE